MSQQTQIVAAVAKRGYMDGWSDDQLAARQLVKMIEELAEASAHIETTSPRFGLLLERLHGLGALARQVFDFPEAWADVTLLNTQALRSETADMAVVLCVLAHALGMDAMTQAQAKATADVSRGVRREFAPMEAG